MQELNPNCSPDNIMEFSEDIVSCIHRCQTKDASRIFIYEPELKLKRSNDYDIGGTYSGTEPELWFHFTTSVCAEDIFLLNLFVIQRKPGAFSISVNITNKASSENDESMWEDGPNFSTNLILHSSLPDDNHYIKTFQLNNSDLEKLKANKLLIIWVAIDMHPKLMFDKSVLKRIKLSHDFSELLAKQEKTDFIIQSASGKEFKTHKIILAAQSPVLKDIIISKATSTFIDISDEDMELLLEFLYTGTIKDLYNQRCMKLLEIADKFKLDNLFTLTQYAIEDQINIQNAIELALLAEKYKLKHLQKKVFSFVKDNPDILETNAWKTLNNANVAKNLLQWMLTGK